MYKKYLTLGAVVLFLTPAITLGAGLFFVDDTGKIGIGTVTPQHMLDVVGSIYSRLVTVTNSSTTVVDWGDGNVQKVTLSNAVTTFDFDNGQAGGEYKLILVQDGTGSREVTWPAEVKWPNGSVPALSIVASSIDIASFIQDGSSYLGSFSRDSRVALAYDNFNRGNSGTVGNGWSETESGGRTAEIVSNKLRMTSNNGGSSSVYRTVNQQSGVKISADFSVSGWASGNQFGLELFTDTSGSNGEWAWYLRQDTGLLHFLGSSSASAYNSIGFTANTTYHAEAIVNQDYSGELRVWAIGSSRPSIPTMTVDAHTPTTAGGADQIYWYNNINEATIRNIDVDNLLIETL